MNPVEGSMNYLITTFVIVAGCLGMGQDHSGRYVRLSDPGVFLVRQTRQKAKPLQVRIFHTKDGLKLCFKSALFLGPPRRPLFDTTYNALPSLKRLQDMLIQLPEVTKCSSLIINPNTVMFYTPDYKRNVSMTGAVLLAFNEAYGTRVDILH